MQSDFAKNDKWRSFKLGFILILC